MNRNKILWLSTRTKDCLLVHSSMGAEACSCWLCFSMTTLISGTTNVDGGGRQLTNPALLNTSFKFWVPWSDLDATSREKPRPDLVLLSGKLGTLPHPLDSPLCTNSRASLKEEIEALFFLSFFFASHCKRLESSSDDFINVDTRVRRNATCLKKIRGAIGEILSEQNLDTNPRWNLLSCGTAGYWLVVQRLAQ